MKPQPSILRYFKGVAKKSLAGQKGVSLIMVMLIMVVVSMLGISGVQISMMAERGARNDRDIQIAFQAAEAALLDAEFDINSKKSSARASKPFFKMNLNTFFLQGCGNSDDSVGLCRENGPGQVPAWLDVDFTDTSTTARTVEFGKFTGREFPVGTVGIQPSQKPRYIIELLDKKTATEDASPYYRVTAMGFGSRPDIQIILQTVYRYSDPEDLE